MPRTSRATVLVALVALLAAVPVAALTVRPSPESGAGAAPTAPARGATLASVHAPRPASPIRGPSVAPRGTRSPIRPSRSGAPVDLRGPSGLPIFPPNPQRPNAAPGLAGATNLYPSVPAPMGVSDLGVGTNGSYEYGTASFEGNATLTSFSAFTPTNITTPAEAAPDWALWQLDAVAVNVSLPPASAGRTNGTFWVQSGLHFNGTTVQLEDNVWNFSTSGTSYIPPSTLTGLHGSIADEEVYVGSGQPFSVTPPSPAHPLAIELFDNISGASGHTVVTFGYSIGGRAGTYDVVTFNGAASSSSPSQFLVDGAKLTPVGLLYDAEFVLGGNGAGSNANILELNGSASLQRSVAGLYVPVPSAFDFGEDTAETALGVAVAYNGTTVRLTAGPSFLYGLWATGGTTANRTARPASEGWIQIGLTVTPSYALVFATNASGAAGMLSAANYSFAPTNASGVLTTDLPPPSPLEPYVFNAWADGYGNGTRIFSASSPSTVLDLTPAPSTVDAPVYLLGTGQAIAFGQARIAGTGFAPRAQTLWLNASQDSLVAPFLRMNELDYPTFPLVVTDGVNLSVEVNGFVQAPATFNYSNEASQRLEMIGWGQGYFFYGGRGGVEVQNTTIEGIAPDAPVAPSINPPSTIEAYGASGIKVTNVTTNDDAVGVTLVDTGPTAVTNVASEGGAVGISALDATDLTVSGVTATGEDPSTLIPSALMQLNATTSVTATDLTVSGPAFGLSSQGGSGVEVSDLTVTQSATGLSMNGTGSSGVTDLDVEAGLASAGSWTNSTGLTFRSVTVNGSGLVLSDDTSVEVEDGSTTGYGSTVVASFADSTEGTFLGLAATDEATAVNLLNCSDVNASGIAATNGSVGAFLDYVVSPTGTDYTSSALSIGLILENASGGPSTFSNFAVTNQSLGAYVANSTGIDLASIVATNVTLGMATVFSNESLETFPIAGVVLFADASVNITGVTAVDFPFAVWSNDTVQLAVADVVDRYGDEAVALNWTNASQVTEAFAFSDALGISVQNCTDATVEDSTLEYSAGVGVWLANGKDDLVQDDNFVGNNNSSVTGHFSAFHLQAYSNGTVDATFRDNYWADRSGATYPVNASGHTVDTSPRASFYPSYLEFAETGLPAGTNWTVDLGVVNYTMNGSVLYLPGWALASGPLSFTVVPIPGYPPHPSSGTLTWDGTSVAQSILFGTSASAGSSFPVWVAVGVAGAAVVAVAAVLLVRSRRRREPPRGPPRSSYPPEPRRRSPAPGHRPAPRRPQDEAPDWLPDDQG